MEGNRPFHVSKETVLVVIDVNNEVLVLLRMTASSRSCKCLSSNYRAVKDTEYAMLVLNYFFFFLKFEGFVDLHINAIT